MESVKTSERRINVLVSTFAGANLPRTLSLPTPASTSVSSVVQRIYSRLPPLSDEQTLHITTTSNKILHPSDTNPLSTLLPPTHDILTLRLSARCLGGKGGFGSQLRAAGGRMSSRKKRAQADSNPTGSNRNLDGRRLRTVDTAKKLAEYLATKPEAERKEREEKKQRWEAVVEAAEKREEEIRSGGKGGRLDAEFVESKEAAEERVREAVLRSMREDARTGSESEVEEKGGSEEGDEESSASSEDVKDESGRAAPTFFGWDDDDEDDSEDDEDVPEPEAVYEGKGKGKAN